MPLIDMPLKELLAYPGRNPKPADFEAYWQRALEELRGVKPQLEFRPSSFQTPLVECTDLFFTGVGGSRIHAKLARPRNRVPRQHPGLCVFHGYSGSAGDWLEYLSWASHGFVVAAMDCRGQGGLSEDRGSVRGTTYMGHIIRGIEEPETLLFRSIFLDTAQLAGILMDLPEVDPERVCASGGSQGGGLTLACAALEPRIWRAAPVYPFLCDYQRVWEMDLAKEAYGELRNYFRRHDPRHERAGEIFQTLGYIDCQHLAPRIRAEVLMGTGLMDSICPPSSQFAAYNKITSVKNHLIYPDFAHEGLPGLHDRIFQFFAP